MNSPTPVNLKVLFAWNLINSLPLWHGRFLSLIACGCFALPSLLYAVTPAPDGGYADHTTAEGQDALFNLILAGYTGNTGIGYHALYSADRCTYNTAVGNEALSSVHGLRNGNTAVGNLALRNNLADENTALGNAALASNTTGIENTGVGSVALGNNITGNSNTAIGFAALRQTTNGLENTATGTEAMFGSFNNSPASYNTATGFRSLYSATTGSSNVADGWQALYANTSGDSNTAIGAIALNENTIGSYNTANGINALRYNTTGNYNTATGGNTLVFSNGRNNSAYGFESLQNNTTGNNNAAVGFDALFNNNSGSNNVALGYQAGLNLTTGSNNIVIGAGLLGSSSDASVTRIGKTTQKKTFIGGIYGKTVASGIGVIINSSGQLGTVQSSARFKEAVKPMDKTSEAILALKPVTFRYKHELDPDGVPQFGLVAEQVEKVNPDLVVRDEDGKVTTVRYDAVNAMLLNEFLKEHRKVEEQERTIDQLKAAVAKQQDAFASKIAQQQKQIEALNAGLQKVSAAVELNKPAPTQVADTR